jgi:predicted  nucleic acid-binding Zn-ribbon protein
MANPKTLTEAREMIAAAVANETALLADNAALKETNEKLQAETQRLQEWGSGLDLTTQNLMQQIGELKAECDALKAAAVVAENKVTEAVAALGVPPVAIAEQTQPQLTKAELWAQYHKLPVEARNAFYKANREAMRD